MIQPRNDYVLIERCGSKGLSGLIILPEVAQEKSILGKVLAIGPGRMVEGVNGELVRKPVEVEVGQLVYFNSKWSEFAGSHYADDQLYDRKLHLVQEADIFLKVDNGKRSSTAIDGRGVAAGSNSGNGEAHQRRQAAKAHRHGSQA